jgi:DDE superfamily endonuclease
MLPDAALPVPASLMTLPAVVSPLFTAPSFRTFTGLACGFLAQSGKRTVCGVLTGAGLSRAWPHDRAHCFFSRARWNPDDLGICVAKLVIGLLVPDWEPVEVLIDDTLFRRRGKKVWAASWFHDGSAPGPASPRPQTPGASAWTGTAGAAPERDRRSSAGKRGQPAC